MADKIKVNINLRGINALMRGEGIQQALHRAGQAVAQAAGEGYACRSDVIKWVAVENVYPETSAAYWRNQRDNTLLKAVGTVGLPTAKTKIDVSGW